MFVGMPLSLNEIGVLPETSSAVTETALDTCTQAAVQNNQAFSGAKVYELLHFSLTISAA